MQTRVARKAARLPLRLPDELVLMIIETCDYLEMDREKTLAALCRLAKRYREGAERLLYSRVELQPHGQGHPGVPGTALHTLARRTTLRPYVNSVDLNIERKYAQDADVWGVLQDLPNVEEISLHLLFDTMPASDRFLGQRNIHLRGLRVQGHPSILRELMQRHPAAFAALTRLDFHLPLTALTSYQLSLFYVGLDTEGLEEAIPCDKAFLATAAPLPSFDIPSSLKDLLAAIPPQVEHLSLVTSFFRADDVATYILGLSRPRALRTLRLGGAVGQGFKEFARTKRAWYADFEWKMEKAGIELTTVG
ncbi:hypothetical protein JCM10450v2_006464 [Rhodotorula kratochvilovae]